MIAVCTPDPAAEPAMFASNAVCVGDNTGGVGGAGGAGGAPGTGG